MIGYVGTYLEGESEGIYEFNLDEEGIISGCHLFARVKNAKYLALEGEYLYSLFDGEKESGIIVFDSMGNCIDSLEFENKTSCFLMKQKEYIYTTNYHEGTVSKIEFKNSKLKLIKQIKIKDKAGCHQIIPFGELFLVPCLFLDEVKVLNSDLEIVDTIFLPKGSGPRHGVLTKDHQMFYLVTELSNELLSYRIKNNQFEKSSQISVLPKGLTHQQGGAGLRMSQDERFLYLSTRGLDLISVIELSLKPKLVQTVSSLGKHPRDLFNVEDQFLLAVNRFSNNLVSYSIKEGLLVENCSNCEVPAGVSVIVKTEKERN